MRKANRFLLFSHLFLPIMLAFQTAEPACSQSTGQTAPLVIRFTGLRSSNGQIAIGINTTSEGWPREAEKEFSWRKGGTSDGVLEVTLPGLPPGTYAISVLDDENGNLEMDMTLGIPREGWGFSGNPPFRLSEPRFEECTITLAPGGSRITIEMRYAGGRKRD